MHVESAWVFGIAGFVTPVVSVLLWKILKAAWARFLFPKEWGEFRKLVEGYLKRGKVGEANAAISKYYQSDPQVMSRSFDFSGLGLPTGTNLAFLSLPSNSRLSAMDAFRVDLSFASLPGVDLDGAKLMASTAYRMSAHGANLMSAALNEAKWEEALLDGASMDSADLGHADLSGASLVGTKLRGASMNGAVLKDANLRRADLTDAEGNEANFNGTDFTSASFVKAAFYGASLRCACLAGVDARGCMLERADLSGADLNGFKFDERTCVRGMNIVGAKNVPQALVDRVASELPTTLSVALADKGPDPDQGAPEGSSGTAPSSEGNEAKSPKTGTLAEFARANARVRSQGALPS